ncbi:hypothetical protein BgiMline_033360, partial [Biomphalaria glabrata]
MSYTSNISNTLVGLYYSRYSGNGADFGISNISQWHLKHIAVASQTSRSGISNISQWHLKHLAVASQTSRSGISNISQWHLKHLAVASQTSRSASQTSRSGISNISQWHLKHLVVASQTSHSGISNISQWHLKHLAVASQTSRSIYLPHRPSPLTAMKASFNVTLVRPMDIISLSNNGAFGKQGSFVRTLTFHIAFK